MHTAALDVEKGALHLETGDTKTLIIADGVDQQPLVMNAHHLHLL